MNNELRSKILKMKDNKNINNPKEPNVIPQDWKISDNYTGLTNIQANKIKTFATVRFDVDPNFVKQLILNGSHVIRFNFAHYDNDSSLLKDKVNSIREHINTLNLQNEILIEGAIPMSNEKVRIKSFDPNYQEPKYVKGDKVLIIKGDSVEDCLSIKNNSYIYKNTNFYIKDLNINHEEVYKVGMLVSISDYIKTWKISALNDHSIELECLKTISYAGNMFTAKGFVVPEVLKELSGKTIQHLSKEDIEIIKAIVDNRLDIISISYVKSVDFIHKIKNFIDSYALEKGIANYKPLIVSKIEYNIKENDLKSICSESDMVSLSRGDLMLNSQEYFVEIYSRVISICNQLNKPVRIFTRLFTCVSENDDITRNDAMAIYSMIKDNISGIGLSDEIITCSEDKAILNLREIQQLIYLYENLPSIRDNNIKSFQTIKNEIKEDIENVYFTKAFNTSFVLNSIDQAIISDFPINLCDISLTSAGDKELKSLFGLRAKKFVNNVDLYRKYFFYQGILLKK